MASLCLKRLTRERERFPTDDSEFWVNWNDADMRHFQAFIVGPEDSVSSYKLIKLRFEVPEQYPFVPPKVAFVQHTGDRVHPNLYFERKVCLSILGTWPGPGWSQNMNIEAVLRTIRSLLDNKPYLHEPNKQDCPSFNEHVRYHSWKWLLLDCLDREGDKEAKVWLEGYLRRRGSNMVLELERQTDASKFAGIAMQSPYARQARHPVDYAKVLTDLKAHVSRAMASQPAAPQMAVLDADKAMQNTQEKRKLPFETESPGSERENEGPATKKQRAVCDLNESDQAQLGLVQQAETKATEVIDLTDD